jgi:hypothetical protein
MLVPKHYGGCLVVLGSEVLDNRSWSNWNLHAFDVGNVRTLPLLMRCIHSVACLLNVGPLHGIALQASF